MTTEKDKVEMFIDPKGGVTTIGTGAGNMRALNALAPNPGPDIAPVLDKIDRDPDIRGLEIKDTMAWLCNLDEGRKRLGFKKEDDGTLAHWVVQAPWAHPIWHSYSIVLIHLRPMPDGRTTRFYLQDATHEMWVMAINPERERNEMVETGIPRDNWMQPKNFAAQFIEISDALALERIRKTVLMICQGALSPDTDWLQDWIKLFGNSMIKQEWR